MPDATEKLGTYAASLRRRLMEEGSLLLEIKARSRSRSEGVAQVMAYGV